eukprot:646856-Alexandrium_andersonii.AAC.1
MLSTGCGSSRPRPSSSSTYHDGDAGLREQPAPTTQQLADWHSRFDRVRAFHRSCRNSPTVQASSRLFAPLCA